MWLFSGPQEKALPTVPSEQPPRLGKVPLAPPLGSVVSRAGSMQVTLWWCWGPGASTTCHRSFFTLLCKQEQELISAQAHTR